MNLGLLRQLGLKPWEVERLWVEQPLMLQFWVMYLNEEFKYYKKKNKKRRG